MVCQFQMDCRSKCERLYNNFFKKCRGEHLHDFQYTYLSESSIETEQIEYTQIYVKNKMMNKKKSKEPICLITVEKISA